MSDTPSAGFHKSSRPRAKARVAEEMEDFQMNTSVERYYSALLVRGRADNPTIGEAKRDLQRDWIQFAISGAVVRL